MDGVLTRLTAVAGRVGVRERWLLGITVAVLLAGFAYQASEWASAQRERYQIAMADLALATQARAEAISHAPRSGDAKAARIVQDWTLHGRNIWVVRLAIEQRIVQTATDVGLKDVQVRVAEAVEGDKALPLLRAEVSGAYSGRPLIRLLRQLSDGQQSFVLDKLEVSRSDAPQFKLSLLFPVQFDGAAG